MPFQAAFCSFAPRMDTSLNCHRSWVYAEKKARLSRTSQTFSVLPRRRRRLEIILDFLAHQVVKKAMRIYGRIEQVISLFG